MKKITEVSKNCIDLIKEFECSGIFQSKPYLCPAKVWTIGFGTTKYFDTGKKVTKNDKPISESEGYRLMIGHIKKDFAPLTDKLLRDDLNQNEFDAVTDFLYNCGATYVDKNGNIQYYKLFEHINNRMPEKELRAYWEKLAITAKGIKQNGLIRRRKAECDLFFS